MGLIDQLGRTALFMLSPERAHNVSIQGLKSGIVPAARVTKDQRLNVELAGLTFPNPVGLAAGYDKNAEVPDAILSLGFGFTEVGTITPKGQPGNPKPRIFRLVEDHGVINRLGFNNEGHDAAIARLKARAHKPGIVGVNIGANKTSEDFVADYEKGIAVFFPLASYFTVNISSPNTPGLRNLQAGEALQVLIDRIFEQVAIAEEKHGRKVPVFLKIAPDLETGEMDEIAGIVSASKLSALIVSNTTLARDGLKNRIYANEAGGLSGQPLFESSTRVVAQMRKRLDQKIPIIGVGGIGNAQQAITKICAGASLVQLYTGMVYEGPCLPSQIVKGMSKYLDETGVASVSELVGTKTEEWL